VADRCGAPSRWWLHSAVRAWAIVLFAAVLSESAYAVQVMGVVREQGTAAPIEGARVREQLSDNVVLTDETGAFSIELDLDAFVVLTAAKEGFYNDSPIPPAILVADPPDPVTIELEAIPDTPDLENPFLDPRDGATLCMTCHVTAFNDWAGDGFSAPSRHSTAGQNTWVRDLVDGSGTGGGLSQPGYVFKRDSTTLALGRYQTGLCAECHLPGLSSLLPDDTPEAARVEMSDATPGSTEGSLARLAHDSGVFCGICHKMESVNDNFGRTGFFGTTQFAPNAILRKTDTALQFGPLDDGVIRFPGQMSAAFNSLHADSRQCAPCHEYNMDHDLDGDFDDEGSPPGQSTYSEWLASSYAVPGEGFKSCQNCHMVSPEEFAQICLGGNFREGSQTHSHRFEGTTLPFLQAAVDLILEASQEGDELVARVDVTNSGAGHHFPTGVSIRNAILVVTAETPGKQPLDWITPGTNLVPDWGGTGNDPNDYGGQPGRGFAKVLRGRNSGDLRVLFIDAIALEENTQIPAGGTDQSRYRFDVSGLADETATVEARIVYRRAWKDLADAKGWTFDGQGNPYGDVLVKSVTAQVALVTVPTPTPTTVPTPTPTPTSTPVPDSCDLIVDNRCDAHDLIAFLRDRRGLDDFMTDFDGNEIEDLGDLYIFSSQWYTVSGP